MSVFADINDWYSAQCDGDWEHSYGVVIETLDNPGWWVKIDLRDTILEAAPYADYSIGDGDDDASWIQCKRDRMQWHGMGDPNRLEEILKRFLEWAKDRDDWLAVPDEADLKQRDDLELWELLGKSRGEEKCRLDDCQDWRIRHSVFCRIHHWEKVLKRRLPEGAA
ncbi:immunity 53 family protein [Adhaeretor mobilis]|uniref:Rhodanese-related sulfurtransferase n=1 Tax=Adhaeretor mobilis TaxID=1930276 RepID=A0A517N291_9BACT|nr:immunity 53 family protein [Adhaeretor mobilis]QDT01256.1 hypothetical protein HG15A2_45980 [Adhaeretor mobilis]